nr:hypothetical protein [uncultured Desulfobulbus sp.]
MAKAKQRREKKEQEKLLQAGRYLEWLVAVREMPVTVELKRDLDRAWAEVRRRSLRTREAFEEYCRLRPELGDVPQSPENLFLDALADLMQNPAEAADAVLAVSGLSRAGLAAQRHLGKILGEGRDWAEIERLLGMMASRPGKISGRQFQSLADCVVGTGLEPVFEALGEAIMTFRKLNHKTHLHKRLSDRFLDDLADTDYLTWGLVEAFSTPLRRLLLLPFAEQVLLHLRHADPSPAPHQVRELLEGVGHTFMDVAGPSLSDDLRAQLHTRGRDDCSNAACGQLEQRFARASFEDRLALLRDFRQVVQREFMHENEAFINLSFSFEGGVSEAMERLLIHCHRSLIGELGQRLPELAVRDRRALVRFWDQVLAEDLSLLIPVTDHDADAITPLVQQAFESGLGGVRLAMLAPLLAGGRSCQLGKLADQALEICSALNDEDLQWFIDEHLLLALRFPKHLQTLFTRIGNNGVQGDRLARSVWKTFKEAARIHEVVNEFGSLMPDGGEAGVPVYLTVEVVRGLAEIAAQIPQLGRLHRFLQACPTGRAKVDDLLQLCDLLWCPEEQCVEFLDLVPPLLEEAREQVELMESMPSLKISKGRLAGLSKSRRRLDDVTDFLRARSCDFRALPLHSLVTLVEQVFPWLDRQEAFSPLLIRTYNVLCARVTNGETDCTPLRDKIDRQMRAMAGNRR